MIVTSNPDTISKGHTEKVVRGEHSGWLPQWIRNYCKSIEWKSHGNTFDTGDALEPEFHWLASVLWLIRNTAYNFKYSLHECPRLQNGIFIKDSLLSGLVGILGLSHKV